MSVLELLGTDRGTIAYHVLVIPALWTMGTIAFLEWRHTRSRDHRRLLWATCGLVVLRIPALFAAGASAALAAFLLIGTELASLLLLGWTFLCPVLSSRVSTLYPALCLGATLPIGAVLLISTSPWQRPYWGAANVLLALIPAVVLLRHQQRRDHLGAASGFAILGLGFGVLFVASLLRATGSRGGDAPAVLTGAGYFFNLLGYPFFAIAAHRMALRDTVAYREELQVVSEEALRQTQELLFLVETSRAIGGSLDLDTILRLVVGNTALALDADRAAIFLNDGAKPSTITLATQYTPLQDVERSVPPPAFPLADQPTLDYALQRRKQLILNVETDNPRLQALYDLLGTPKAGPTIVQPLLGQKNTLGALVVGNDHSQRAFEPSDGRLCQSVAVQVAAAIENARLYRDLQAQTGQLAELLQLQEDEVRRRMAILESVTDGVLVSDAEGRVVVVNAAAERILATSRKRIQGRSLKHLTGHTALDPKADWEVIAESDTPLETVFELENRIVHASSAPVLTPAGDHLGVVAVLRDITKETEAEQAKSEFITAISHELRTPLTAIGGYAAALSSGMVGALSEAQVHFLRIIQDNAMRMGSLSENLIAVSKLEKEGLDLDYAETDLHLIIGDVVQSFRAEIEGRQLELSLELDSNLPVLEADPTRVQQMLDNLVSNAAKFTYPGGRITIGARPLSESADKAPEHCAFWVADTGIGIAPEEQAHIWERFYRPSDPLALQSSGLGVGLSIVKSLVQAHGGRVWLDSSPGEGSTFTVLLPIRRPQPVGG